MLAEFKLTEAQELLNHECVRGRCVEERRALEPWLLEVMHMAPGTCVDGGKRSHEKSKTLAVELPR